MEQASASLQNVNQLDSNWRTFNRLIEEAHRTLEKGDVGSAAVIGQTAATFAYFNHTGVFASPPLEKLLERIGRETLDERDLAPSKFERHPKPRVVHVATQIYDIGGHTQMMSKWIEKDKSRDHFICLTSQSGSAIPGKILNLFEDRSKILLLDETCDDLISRAAALREYVRGADAVILHVHSFDVVPSIALSGNRPWTVFVNHPDHVFWIGRQVADVVMNLRPSGAKLSSERRGIEADRSLTLTVAVDLPERTLSRQEAKQALGVDLNTVVVVTAAHPSKYEAIDGKDFLDIVLPTLERAPGAKLIAVGPSPVGRWAMLQQRDLGRALGLLPDIRNVLQAGDIYVDSYPFASITSMLEAGAYGLPVMTYQDRPIECAVLGPDLLELNDTMIVARDPESFGLALDELINSETKRTMLGARNKSSIDHRHANNAWVQSLEQLFQARRPSVPNPHDVVRQTGVLDQTVERLQFQTGFGRGEVGAMLVNANFMPLADRIRLVWRAYMTNTRWKPITLLSARQVRILRRLRSKVRRLHS